MSKHTKLFLTDDQRSHLENLIRSGNAPARTQTKARILLMTDGHSVFGFTDWVDAKVMLGESISAATSHRYFAHIHIQRSKLCLHI